MVELRVVDEMVSVEDYLEGEKSSEVRHEYVAGVVYAMSGGSRNHNRIALNIASDLEGELRGGGCRPFINDVKLRMRLRGEDVFYYPDVMVGCDASDDHELYLERPKVIFEVSSASTERLDRREKFWAYSLLDSLEEYVMVSQKAMEVKVMRARSDWQVEVIEGADGVLVLESLGLELKLGDVYREIVF